MRMALLCFIVVSALSLFTGCGTLTDAQNARGTGARRVFDASADKVWTAIPEALASLGLDVASSNRSEGCILASRGLSGGSWGEKVAVFVQEVSSSRTEVEVVSKKALETNIGAQNWENPVLNRIEDILRTPER